MVHIKKKREIFVFLLNRRCMEHWRGRTVRGASCRWRAVRQPPSVAVGPVKPTAEPPREEHTSLLWGRGLRVRVTGHRGDMSQYLVRLAQEELLAAQFSLTSDTGWAAQHQRV